MNDSAIAFRAKERIPLGEAEPMTGRSVLATAYFASVWLGRHVKREVLAEHLAKLSQRLKEVPEFANYAIAEGLKRAFTRFGKFCRKILDPEPDPEPAIIYQTLPGFEKFFNPDLC